MTNYVFNFDSGDATQADLLGGKGANLAEMTRLGLPVPPGFTITTDACRYFLAEGAVPSELEEQVRQQVDALEKAIGRRFGDSADPLLVSVRSGAKVSMPGMMDTVLNVGLNDETVHGLAATFNDEAFAADTYRRLLTMFGQTVLGLDAALFSGPLSIARTKAGVDNDGELPASALWDLVNDYKDVIYQQTGSPFPQNPLDQLWMAIEAVFTSWNGERAKVYRKREGIPDDLGTAVNIVGMVFGNRGSDSGTGVAFTRDPSSGEPGVWGDYLANAQGEDVVAGIRNVSPLADLEHINPTAYRQLLEHMELLEQHYRDVCDIEFTIEQGKLWMLQTRIGKRTPAAAFRVAIDLVDEGLISADEALTRVSGEQLTRLMFPAFDRANAPEPIASGVAAAPGAAVGQAIFDPQRAAEKAEAGEDVILIRDETNPDDLPGMIGAVGILTARGGKTSHAAVVARGLGKTCVCGADSLEVLDDHAKGPNGSEIHEGDIVSIDGTSGEIWADAVAVTSSPVEKYFKGELGADADALTRAVDRLMTYADERSRMEVWANADTGADAALARRFGAVGIGLCRTEHMFLGDRRELVEKLILAEPEQRGGVLEQLKELQVGDFQEILEAMDELPVVIRLLDPPLHEFLPSFVDLSVENAVNPTEANAELLRTARKLHEHNPMLGLRGVRLGIVLEGLYTMQIQAVAEAAARLSERGLQPKPEIMIPLVGDHRELEIMKDKANEVLSDFNVEIPVGTMIEVPRAALTADRIAPHADFFSFGTNDLTQMTWGFSRDDVEGSFFSEYLEQGVFETSPFATLDTDGVGSLVSTAVSLGRKANSDMHIGVCGEHGGDPASIQFFNQTGLDYVSCSPYRAPVARLASGQAAVKQKD
ncbi:pyruvate, phosphate dikinase [Haloglycomyces albus]|uniref:pyruvate, phosphate dikinase n=1 Tax=Haloglycomyces albus TaxID=526067 RepID=UPI00046D8768|nr:pyruvate, phosphate dikinase [Haloglycomyces albus]